MLKPALVLALFAVSCPVLLDAQAALRGDDVNGIGSGIVKLQPNPKIGQTVAVFTSEVPLKATSNQIVFVFMQDKPPYPPAWSGKARVFTGDGFLAFASEDGERNLLLKFDDRGIPPALAKMSFESVNGYGIARYGETVPLTDSQIASLAETGRLPEHEPMCVSGGRGATTATLSPQVNTESRPLSVTCQPGYFACCGLSGRCACENGR